MDTNENEGNEGLGPAAAPQTAAGTPPARQDVEVLYEDDRYLIVNKPVGTSVQNDAWGEDSLLSTLAERFGKKLFLTHRIDKPVSGVVVLARTPAAQTDLQKLFTDHAVDKRYWAVVDAQPKEPAATVESWIFFDTRQNKSFVFDKKPEKKPSLARGSKFSTLTYRTVGASDRYWFLEVKLLSGRHHQIRAQLAHIGCHIKGDLKYGARRSNQGGGIHLHARSISFFDPATSKTISAVAAPPADPLWDLFTGLAAKDA